MLASRPVYFNNIGEIKYTKTKEKPSLHLYSPFTVPGLMIHIQTGQHVTGLLKLAKNHLQLKGKKKKTIFQIPTDSRFPLLTGLFRVRPSMKLPQQLAHVF